MPEGPEVKILVENLNKKLKNKTLENIEIIHGRYLKKKPDNFDIFLENLPLKIKDIKCKGKFIYFILEEDWFIFNTLGMSGRWTVHDKLKNNNLVFNFNNNLLYFNDIRNFGTFKFINEIKVLNLKLKTLGIDIFDKEFTFDIFHKLLKKKTVLNKTLPVVFLNQKIISGIGNYLKCEILYKSKISPYRLVKDLTKEEIQLLYNNILLLSKKFYKMGSAYSTNLEDVTEEFSETDTFEIYKKKKDKNGYSICRDKTPDKRSTYWVKEVQL